MFLDILSHWIVIGICKEGIQESPWWQGGLNTGCLMPRCDPSTPPWGLSCTPMHFCAGWFWLMGVPEWGGQCSFASPPLPLQGPGRKHDHSSMFLAGKDAHDVPLSSLLPGPVLAHLHQLCHSWTGDALWGWVGGCSSVRVWRQGFLFQ